MAEDGNKVCILLLIGLPGSGKSHLTNFLVNYFQHSNYNLSVFPFSYDELMPCLKESNSESLKDKRKLIFNNVQSSIAKIMSQNNTCNENLTKAEPAGNSNTASCNTLIVIDDNMYYRSMRYEYFKLSKLLRVGFCQIFIEATLEQSLSVNSKRNKNSQVPEETIARMNNFIEIPDKTNHWERLSISIPFHASLDNTEVMYKIECLIKEAMLTSYETNYSSNTCIGNEKSNKISLVHLVDLSLRCIIRSKIEGFGVSNKDEVRRSAEDLNTKKCSILHDLRSNRVILPKNIVEALEDQNTHNKELIHNYLQNLLAKYS